MKPIPFDLDAEANVLGAAVSDRLVRERACGALTVSSFHDVKHQAVFAGLARLVSTGRVVDVTTLADELAAQGTLEKVGGRGYLLGLHAESSAVSALGHVAIVSRHATRRQLIALAAEVDDHARDLSIDPADVVGALERETERVSLPVDEQTPIVDALALASEPDDYDWMVPKLLERGDRIIWTAGEGVGKSTVQLQLAVTLSSGVHPFFGYSQKPLRVLLVDLENSRRQLRRRLRLLLDKAGERYQGGLGVVSRIEGIDLRAPRDFRWLDALCEKHRPDLLVIGPLYKSFRVKGGEKKSDETAAEEAAFALDRLRERHQLTLSLEAHSPHGHQGDREGLRPYGASLWLRWPEFGIGLKPVVGEASVELVHWRGARDRDREWPEILGHGTPGMWPWVAIERSVA